MAMSGVRIHRSLFGDASDTSLDMYLMAKDNDPQWLQMMNLYDTKYYHRNRTHTSHFDDELLADVA